MVTPAQGSGSVSIKLPEPIHPLISFAETAYDPAVKPLKTPEAWKAPPLILYENPVLPEADATILPLFPPTVVGFVSVAVTVITNPVQGFGAVKVKLADPIQPLPSFAVME